MNNWSTEQSEIPSNKDKFETGQAINDKFTTTKTPQLVQNCPKVYQNLLLSPCVTLGKSNHKSFEGFCKWALWYQFTIY